MCLTNFSIQQLATLLGPPIIISTKTTGSWHFHALALIIIKVARSIERATTLQPEIGQHGYEIVKEVEFVKAERL